MAAYEDLLKYGANQTFTYSAAYAAGAAQDAILLPARDVVSVTLSFDAAGTATIYGTNSSHNDIRAASAIWKEWTLGAVAATAQDVGHKLTGIYVSRTSGTPRVTVTL